MKKEILVLLLIFGCVKISLSQNPEWLWAEAQTSGNCYMQGTGIWASPSGSIYMNGRFSGNLSLGAQTAYSANSSQPFSGKMNSAGTFSWLTPQVTYLPGGNDYCYGFGGDKYGNTYSTGLINSGSGIFANAYDSTGAEIWSKSFEPTSGSMQGGGFAIAADNNKNVYVTGGYGGTINFGPVTLTASGYDDMFLAKLDNAGNCLWAVDAGPIGAGEGGLDDGGRGIAVDQAGNIYVCGGYSGTTSFSGTITLPTTYTHDFFIAKYNNAGTVLWVQTAKNAGFVGPDNYWWSYNGLAIDSCSNIYVTGRFTTTAQFGSLSVSSKGGADVFVAKCLAGGQWEWVQSAGGTSDDAGLNLALDKNSDIYITGYFEGAASFGNESVGTASTQTVYVAKCANSNGAFQWVKAPVDTNAFMNGTGITVDKQGFIYITGPFGINPGKTSTFGSSEITGLTGCGQNIFVAKLDTTPARNIIPQINNAYCPGEMITLPYTLTGSFNNDNIFTAQLSNDSGSFISPVSLGAINSATSGNINITIPANTPSGSNYLIRIISSSPAGSSYANCHSYITISGNISVPIVSDDTSICSGSSIQLHASGGTSYSWSPGTYFNDSTIANPVLTPVTSQIYKVTVSNGSCGSSSAKVAVIVTPGANITVKPVDTTVCSGASLSLEASGATTYFWSPGSTLSDSTGANPVVTPVSSTSYTVTGGSGACSSTFVVNVNVANTYVGGVVTAVRDTICQNTPGSLTLAGNSNNHIQWQSSTNDINFIDAVSDTLINYKTVPLFQTTWYRAVVGTGNCSAVSGALMLYVPPALTASFYSTQTAANQLTFNSDSSIGNIRSYHWDFGDGQTSAEQNPQHSFAKDSAYYVCLTLYDGSNCSYTFCRYSSITDAVYTVSAGGNWIVYPNPFTDWLIISTNQSNSLIQSVEIYDVLSRVVINENLNNKVSASLQLDVSLLAKGMYYVMIKTPDADYVQKVIKQ